MRELAKTAVLIMLCSVGMAMIPTVAFAADQVTVTSGGGTYQAVLRKAIFEPFEKASGIKVTEEEWNYEVAKVRAMVKSATVSWDVVDMTPESALVMCNEGGLEKVDWKRLGLDRSNFVGAEQSECGVPSSVAANIVAYDVDKLPNGPKSISDLFDTRRFPGKRGLLNSPRVNIEWALIADGVPLKDVYMVLRTAEGVDRAFRKLDSIKQDAIWFTSSAQAVQLLADSQVVMTSATNGRIYEAVKKSGKNFAIMWDAQQFVPGVWAIPKGSQRVDAAYKFISFAGRPQQQAAVSELIPYGPMNKEAVEAVDAAIRPHLPTSEEHMRSYLVRDAAFWAENGDELNQRFSNWLAK